MIDATVGAYAAEYQQGVTKREWLIGKALSGHVIHQGDDSEAIAMHCIEIADAIIRKLDEKE